MKVGYLKDMTSSTKIDANYVKKCEVKWCNLSINNFKFSLLVRSTNSVAKQDEEIWVGRRILVRTNGNDMQFC